MRYAELHCHSYFSFLDGVSSPVDLATQAARLGLEALALTDHDGMYGIVQFAEAARELGVKTVFGAELSLGLSRPQNGVADPEGQHLLVLARDPVGYASLCRVISEAQLRGKEKGKPVYDDLQKHRGHWIVTTGCRKGTVPRALVKKGPQAAQFELHQMIDLFGRDNVVVELWDHGDPLDSARNDAMAELGLRAGVEIIATNNVHYATPSEHKQAAAAAALRARRSCDEFDAWLPVHASAYLRSPEEQARRFVRYPGVVERAAEIGSQCAFDLRLVAPGLPPYPCPPGHNEMSWLKHLVFRDAPKRYEGNQRAYERINHELDVIEQLNFPGYFLIVWDIVQYCKRENIFCQGRGSAANSAVCYVLGITLADAVGLGLVFERFLSPVRDGPPDIDLDIESGDRREQVIQYVYSRYGRHHAAMVANVVTYRPKLAIRDAAKALGHGTGQQDAWSKQADGWGFPEDHDIPVNVMSLAKSFANNPRHLGIHSGGMVLCDRPVIEVCPVEWARMENRSVLQWDKDDCAAAGLVKFDLLGLGMLNALHIAVDLAATQDIGIDLATIPQDDAVYDMLCKADTVGVFQVESRAQMATLPRLKPRCFYDLVVEVALIRPGPIQGGSVHPYLRRRNGQEPVTYLHPVLEPVLKRTLGVPLFQEQLMQLAVAAAGFSAADADELRQAIGAKRSHSRMERLRVRLYDGMAVRGITGAVADAVWNQIQAFANFGFPESHSVSFSYLVYASAWIKYHYPAVFLTALLNAQPMGFYSPQSLVADARRHGVKVLRPCVNTGGAKATLSSSGVRLGLSYVRTIGSDLAERIQRHRPYTGMEDLSRRCELPVDQIEALATSGALSCFGLDRREALWSAGAVSQSRPGRLKGIVTGLKSPRLQSMSEIEVAGADLWATSVSPDCSPAQFARSYLNEIGAVTVSTLESIPHGTKVTVGGVVTHRQRPATASGTTFINLEDETGLLNVICSPGMWTRYRRIARGAKALVVWGKLERHQGVTNLIAWRLLQLDMPLATTSRDFR